MKFKALALAALAFASVSAHASIARPDVGTGNSELFLVVFDDNASYTKDLGITLTAWEGLSSSSQTWSFAGDSYYSQFAAQVSNPANVKWAVLNGKTTGDLAAAGDVQLFTTVKVGDEAAALAELPDNFNTGLATLGTFEFGVSGTGSHIGATSINGSSFNTKGTSGYFNPSLANMNNALTFNVTNAAGATSQFVKLTSNDGDPFSAALSTVYSGAMKLNASSLTYTVPTAAVPEPGTYAMLLAGLGALGFVARRRSAR